jgi:hypothetical protein
MSKPSKSDSRRKNKNDSGEAAKNEKNRVQIIASEDSNDFSEGSYASIDQPEEKAIVKITGGDDKKSPPAESIKKYTQEQLDAEADITYYVVEFIAHAKIPASEFIASSKNGQDLNGTGDIIFSLDNGRLKLGKQTNADDFMRLTSGNMPTDNKKSKKKNGTVDQSSNLDIAKSVRLEDFKFNYDNQFVITANTIPKYANEGYYGNSNNVNHVVMPGAMSKLDSDKLELLNRSISTRVILFQNQYPGVSLDTFANDIQPAREGLSFVHFGSPLIGAINEDKAGDTPDGVYKAPTAALERTMQVLVPTKLVKTYERKMLDVMKNSISYANVINGFSLTFTAPIPDHRLAAHREWVKTSKQSGMPFLAFADHYHRTNASLSTTFSNKKEAINLNELPDLDISFRCIVQYRHITNEPIQINNL